MTRQAQIASHKEQCFFADAPTLADVNVIYGRSAAISWLAIQMVNISNFCGARDKITDTQIYELSEMILLDYYFLKLPEVMLFCQRFKAGSYDTFYGAADPVIILRSIKAFIRERNEAYAKRERQLEAERWEREKNRPGIMDYETYLFIKQVTAEYEMLTAEQDRQIENKRNTIHF